jgi:hypothetical protein
MKHTNIQTILILVIFILGSCGQSSKNKITADEKETGESLNKQIEAVDDSVILKQLMTHTDFLYNKDARFRDLDEA